MVLNTDLTRAFESIWVKAADKDCIACISYQDEPAHILTFAGKEEFDCLDQCIFCEEKGAWFWVAATTDGDADISIEINSFSRNGGFSFYPDYKSPMETGNASSSFRTTLNLDRVYAKAPRPPAPDLAKCFFGTAPGNGKPVEKIVSEAILLNPRHKIEPALICTLTRFNGI